MNLKELYTKLKEAYSDENLNIITGKLIDLYKNKNFEQIREVANRISKYFSIKEEKDAKCFSKLVVLYHPDKGELFRKEIKKHYFENNFENLTKFSHIFLLKGIESIAIKSVNEDIEYRPEYEWDSTQSEGYHFYETDLDESIEEEDFIVSDYEKSFYNAIKLREYGNLNIEFPSYYLEDIDEFELSNYGIESLDGIEHCKHTVILDLSNNEIADISELWCLNKLEELYLANNQIGYIDALSSLLKLRVIDLSGNQIDDISPLSELDNLEYVNLVGNNIPQCDINKMKEKGIIVII
jgi:Leucine-rich repeat (LRR) protein